jgi:hypothetical protein
MGRPHKDDCFGKSLCAPSGSPLLPCVLLKLFSSPWRAWLSHWVAALLETTRHTLVRPSFNCFAIPRALALELRFPNRPQHRSGGAHRV